MWLSLLECKTSGDGLSHGVSSRTWERRKELLDKWREQRENCLFSMHCLWCWCISQLFWVQQALEHQSSKVYIRGEHELLAQNLNGVIVSRQELFVFDKFNRKSQHSLGAGTPGPWLPRMRRLRTVFQTWSDTERAQEKTWSSQYVYLRYLWKNFR